MKKTIASGLVGFLMMVLGSYFLQTWMFESMECSFPKTAGRSSSHSSTFKEEVQALGNWQSLGANGMRWVRLNGNGTEMPRSEQLLEEGAQLVLLCAEEKQSPSESPSQKSGFSPVRSLDFWGGYTRPCGKGWVKSFLFDPNQDQGLIEVELSLPKGHQMWKLQWKLRESSESRRYQVTQTMQRLSGFRFFRRFPLKSNCGSAVTVDSRQK